MNHSRWIILQMICSCRPQTTYYFGSLVGRRRSRIINKLNDKGLFCFKIKTILRVLSLRLGASLQSTPVGVSRLTQTTWCLNYDEPRWTITMGSLRHQFKEFEPRNGLCLCPKHLHSTWMIQVIRQLISSFMITWTVSNRFLIDWF